MRKFVFSGKKKIFLDIDKAKFLFRKKPIKLKSREEIEKEVKRFFNKYYEKFLNKKVCVVIPDNTRFFHPKIVLPLLNKYLRKLTSKSIFIIALGLHNRLDSKELSDLLGKRFIKQNKIIQHSFRETVFLKNIGEVPFYVNKNILTSDVIITVGVVEPHLYAGFSGGVKCLGVGVSGKKTILYTHSVSFLKKKGVRIASVKNNPFQKFLWKAKDALKKDVYSLNIVNSQNKRITFVSFDESFYSFSKALKFVQKQFFYSIKNKFDVLFVGCDFPKERSFYQTSRLFNYMLDKKPLVIKGGAIFVFANLKTKKSRAEENFEKLLKRKKLPQNYSFKKAGEHRAYKVKEASKYAFLGIINPSFYGNFPEVLFFQRLY